MAVLALAVAGANAATSGADAQGGSVPITGPESSQAALRQRSASVPDDATLVAQGAVVGEVTFRAFEIFDTSNPKEDNWLFRLANTLHVRTRETTLRRLLLLAPGDAYSPERIVESERILREQGYLYDAWIRPARYDGKRVDLEVTTRDVWTLQIGVGFGRSGGENLISFGLEDSNFLGTGTELTLRRTSNVDRTETLYRYRDPNLAGSRVRIEAAYADNSDGRQRQFSVERPFYSVDARWSAGAGWFDNDREDTLWEAGEETDRFRHQEERVAGSAGFSRGVVAGRAVRWRGGYAWQQDRFEAVPGIPPPSVVLEDRRLSYPWFGFELVPDAFVRGRDLDRLVRTEDLRFGRSASATLGFSSPVFGGDRSRAIFDARTRFSTAPAERQLVDLEAGLSGRWESSGIENLQAKAVVRYYRRDFGRHVFYTAIDLGGTVNLDAERQLLIGGDSGLRGWPLRYQSGDRRALLTVEQRFYTDWNVLQLVHVGAAAFADVGRAWFTGRDDLDRPWLGDIGLGLRLGSSRSARGALVHVDVAWAINAPEGVSDVQFLVETKDRF